ncbi:peptidase C14 [Streptomyces ambofaciens]|uniref:Peptidase C14 n=1 Tax=Streptomyces ambofaciens TaxID=1889 RepID=A0ABM6AT23_STRAM|nr:peptidase C14 [Streptomyces ambofaciens]ANB04419.1 peptidase C14 [Streptomyces ambofaciens]
MSEPGTVARSVEHQGSVQAIAFSPDSTRFASGGSDNTLRVRPVLIGEDLDVPVGGSVTGIAFGPDGGTFVVADFEQVSLRDGADGSATWQGPLDPGNSVNAVRFAGDGQIIATTDVLVAVLDPATGAITRRVTVDPPLIADVDVSGDGTRVALAVDHRHGGNHQFTGDARVVELATGEVLGKLTPDDAVHAVAFSPDADTVLCCAADDTTRMFESVGGGQVWPLPEETDEQITAPNCLAYDPKGRWTVVGGADGFARVLDAATGVEKCRVPKLQPGAPDPGLGAVTHVAFSPNGKLAASASIDNVVRLFGLTGQELYAAPTDEVLTLEFSPDGRWLGVGCFARALVLDNGESNSTQG